jgi:hypothetical protein
MIEIELHINKANVYDEVAKTTSYTGAKMVEDDKAYDRIFTTDADRQMLERFWLEACNGATEQFKPFLVSVSNQQVSHGVELSADYIVTLEVSNSYDTTLTQSIETSLYSYFVMYIVSKWYKFTNKDESESCGNDAVGAMDDVMRKLYFRKKPTRRVPTT